MLKDRMQELTLLTKGKIIGSKLAKPLLTEPDWDGSLKHKIDEAERILRNINSTTEEIGTLKQSYKKATTHENEKEISKQLDAIVKRNHSDVENLNAIVKDVQQEAKRSTEVNKNSAEARAATIAHQNLVQKMRVAVTQCTTAQQQFKSTAKDKIKRTIRIIKSQATEEQADSTASNPAQLQRLLKQTLFNEHSIELQNAVSDIEDKYRDIVKLQQNINECLKLMQDLAVLVTYQGEMLNNIQLVLDDSKDYVEDADAKLKKAKQHHKASQKKICCVVMLVLMLIGIILTISLLVTQIK